MSTSTAHGAILVEIIAVGGLRRDADGYWLPVKCAQRTWRRRPVVRFIDIKPASMPHARGRTS